jgi:hypothetical protein
VQRGAHDYLVKGQADGYRDLADATANSLNTSRAGMANTLDQIRRWRARPLLLQVPMIANRNRLAVVETNSTQRFVRSFIRPEIRLPARLCIRTSEQQHACARDSHLPELPVYEIGGEAAQERELVRCKRPNATSAASSGFDQPLMIALALSRMLELGGGRLRKVSRPSSRLD